jgi:hypothetical protein
MDEQGQDFAVSAEVEHIFQAKREWHKKQANLPLKEKVRILLQMQKDDYPILKARGVLRSWEKPWNVEP